MVRGWFNLHYGSCVLVEEGKSLCIIVRRGGWIEIKLVDGGIWVHMSSSP